MRLLDDNSPITPTAASAQHHGVAGWEIALIVVAAVAAVALIGTLFRLRFRSVPQPAAG